MDHKSDHEAYTPAAPASPSAESGASAVEYALLISLIALVIIGAVAVLGLNLGSLFNGAATSFSNF